MKTQTFKIPAELEANLAQEARRRRISKSAIIRQTLAKRYKTNGKSKHRTASDLIGHLIGVLDGPHDIATNPKYLEGLGE